MNSDIPLEVLGLLGPLLSWSEATQADGLPKNWRLKRETSFSVRDWLLERNASSRAQDYDWLLNELPTYSLDDVDGVIAIAGNKPHSSIPSQHQQFSQISLAPPFRFDLFHVFEKLTHRYLTWNGGEVCVREGRMIEVHELGLRLPLTCLTRHAHARAILGGEQNLEDVLSLPEPLTLLPSNAHGMRSVIRRGLAEGHLHMNSIHAAEVAWADHLLNPMPQRPRDYSLIDWRLRLLCRTAAQILALATAYSCADCEPDNKALGLLFDRFDDLYFAADWDAFLNYQKRIDRELNGLIFREPASQNSAIRALHRADPWPCHHRSSPGIRTVDPKGNPCCTLGLMHWFPELGSLHQALESPHYASKRLRSSADRLRCISDLHLAAHLELVRCHFLHTNVATGRSMDPTCPDDGQFFTTFRARHLHRAYYQYLVCQIHFWHKAVQQGQTTGLRRFKQYFDSKQRNLMKPSLEQQAVAALQRVQNWRGLRHLEGRVSPPERSAADLRPWLQAFATGARRGRIEKMGLVVHFIKEFEPPRNHSGGWWRARYAPLRDKYRKEAIRLFRILEKPTPEILFIVGIDAANLELATPPEVLAPVFRFLRERPIALAGSDAVPLEDRKCIRSVRELMREKRLGMTYHVGEDFRHLLSGLRAIDEVIEFMAPSPGDRLGHCIALGLDPQTWFEQVQKRALVPKQEWLDTLVWTYHFLGPGDDFVGLLGIESNIIRLARELYPMRGGPLSSEGNPRLQKYDVSVASPFSLHDVWRLRQLDPEFLDLGEKDDPIKFRPIQGQDSATWRWNRIGSQVVEAVKRQIGINPPYDLLARYWFSKSAYEAGKIFELVDMEAKRDLWIQVCQKIQIGMQKKVARHQLTVEVNPSSNRVIGHLGSYADHHIFNLTLDHDNRFERKVKVTVNTDNPGTANTSLAHEYYLLGEAMMTRNVPEAEVVNWLEWLRQNGHEASFAKHIPDIANSDYRKILAKFNQSSKSFRGIHDPDVCLAKLWRQWPKRR